MQDAAIAMVIQFHSTSVFINAAVMILITLPNTAKRLQYICLTCVENMENNKPLSILSITIYAMGVLIGLTLALIAAWPDYEASSYGFARRASAPLNGLRCPVILNRDETGTISLKISNTTDKPLSPSVRMEISTPDIPDSFLESMRLAPGESRKLEWSIGPGNIDLQHFIFASVLVYASYPIPNREATCGAFIIDLPISGTAFLIIMVTFSVISMGSGLYMLNKTRQPSRAAVTLRPMIFLTGEVALALIFSLIGWWIQSVLVLVISVLTIVVALNFLSLKEK